MTKKPIVKYDELNWRRFHKIMFEQFLKFLKFLGYVNLTSKWLLINIKNLNTSSTLLLPLVQRRPTC